VSVELLAGLLGLVGLLVIAVKIGMDVRRLDRQVGTMWDVVAEYVRRAAVVQHEVAAPTDGVAAKLLLEENPAAEPDVARGASLDGREVEL
jgi:hypothetical protein